MAKRNIFDEHRLALAGASMCGDLLKEAEARIAQLESALRPTEAEIEVAADEWPWQEKTKGEGFRAGIAWMQGRVVLLPPLETPVSTLCAICDQIKELHPSTHPWTAKPSAQENASEVPK